MEGRASRAAAVEPVQCVTAQKKITNTCISEEDSQISIIDIIERNLFSHVINLFGHVINLFGHAINIIKVRRIMNELK